MGWWKVILWVAIGLGLIVIGSLFLINRNLWGVLFILVGFWSLMSIKIVGPDEMAVFVVVGQPIGFRDSGPSFVPWLLAWLVRYPKKMYNLDYPAREVISKEGEYPPEEKERDPKKRRYYGAQVLTVNSVAYLKFPQDEKLIEILKSKIPIDDRELLNWTEESVVGSLRVALGKITWKEATEDIEGVRKRADAVFKAKDGALLRAGFKEEDIRLTIKEIRLLQGLKEALVGVDRQRLEAEAAPFEAEQRAEETIGTLIQMLSRATGRTPKEVQSEINGSEELRREFRFMAKDLVRRQMAIDGKSFVDIRIQGAESLERILLNLLAAWKRMPMGLTQEALLGEAGEKTKEKKEETPPEEGGERERITRIFREKRPMEKYHQWKKEKSKGKF